MHGLLNRAFGHIAILPFLLAGIFFSTSASASASIQAETLIPRAGLILGRGGMRGAGGGPGGAAAIEAMLTSGTLSDYQPQPGQRLGGADGAQWTRVTLDEKGATSARGELLYLPLSSSAERVMILNATGHATAYLNGEPRGGDPYGNGYIHLPVLLRPGTNHRPYGFDWEDFGRADAMEVLELAKAFLPHDPARIYLTGHSMGGHGAWHLGVTYPDTFAAIGPSAGWISRESYGGARGANAGNTIALAGNLKNTAVYMLHGEKDDNVPMGQARRMAQVLGGFHHDWIYHEEPGKGHWWGNEFNDGGSACVDWPLMLDLFARHALPPPGATTDVTFTTVNPGVSSRCRWLGIEAQEHQLDFSSATLHAWSNRGRVKGNTHNVAVLRLDLGRVMTSQTVNIELDGQQIREVAIPKGTGTIWLEHSSDSLPPPAEAASWRVIPQPAPTQKNPRRYGSIKDELRHRFMFVYGTRGSAAENEWAFAKARFDAETWWCRGNGSVDILADKEMEKGEFAFAD